MKFNGYQVDEVTPDGRHLDEYGDVIEDYQSLRLVGQARKSNVYGGVYQRIFKIANSESLGFIEGVCEIDYRADGDDMILTVNYSPDGHLYDKILALKGVEEITQ